MKEALARVASPKPKPAELPEIPCLSVHWACHGTYRRRRLIGSALMIALLLLIAPCCCRASLPWLNSLSKGSINPLAKILRTFVLVVIQTLSQNPYAGLKRIMRARQSPWQNARHRTVVDVKKNAHDHARCTKVHHLRM